MNDLLSTVANLRALQQGFNQSDDQTDDDDPLNRWARLAKIHQILGLGQTQQQQPQQQSLDYSQAPQPSAFGAQSLAQSLGNALQMKQLINGLNGGQGQQSSLWNYLNNRPAQGPGIQPPYSRG